MKINVIECPKFSTIEEVWKISRPNDNKFNINDIIEIDAPINDFATFVLDITSTMAEREVIVKFREHIMWAQTSRVNDVTKFTVDEYFDSSMYEEIRKNMIMQMESNANQDDYRLNLPIVSVTRYSLKASIRTIVNIANEFLMLSEINPFFRNSFNSIYKVLKQYKLDRLIDIYKHISNNSQLTTVEKHSSSDYIIITMYMPLALRTHIIRHRSIHIIDNFVDMLYPDTLPDITLLSKIGVKMAAPRGVWQSIFSKRSCWIAHHGIWKDLLNKINAAGKFNESGLPCSDGNCPFSADAMLRIEGKDPGVPCPKHILLTKLEVSKFTVKRMEAYIKSEERPLFWNEYIEALK